MKIVVIIVLAVVLSGMEYLYLSRVYNRKKVLVYSAASAVITMAAGVAALYIGLHILEGVKRECLLILLFTVSLSDYKEKRIPNHVLLAGVILRILLYGIEIFARQDIFFEIVKSDLWGLGIMFIFFLTAYFIIKNGVGMGDIKLMMVMSLYVGLEGVFSALFCSLIIIFILAVYLLIRKKKNRKDTLPFAPAVLAGTLLSLFLNGI